MFQLPWVAGDLVRRVLSRSPHGEFVHVGPADNDRIGVDELGKCRGGIGRPEMLEHPRCTACGNLLPAEYVFDADRDGREWSELLPCPLAAIELFGLGECLIGLETEKRSDLRIDRLDSIEECGGYLNCRRFARSEISVKLESGRLGELVRRHG